MYDVAKEEVGRWCVMDHWLESIVSVVLKYGSGLGDAASIISS